MSSKYKHVLVLISTSFMILILAIATVGYWNFQKEKRLRDRGVEVVGQLERAFGSKPRNSWEYVIVYTYLPGGAAEGPRYLVHAQASISPAEFMTLTIGQKLSVIYDPSDFSNSRPILGDEARKIEPSSALIHPMVAGIFFLLIATLVNLAIFCGYRRQSAILRSGIPTRATIVQEQECWQRSTSKSLVTYRFTDSTGRSVESQVIVPGSADLRPDSIVSRRSLMSNPTVVFDPKDSGRNVLYPPVIAEVR